MRQLFRMLSWQLRCLVGVFFLLQDVFLECSLSGGSVDENAQIVALHPMCGWEVFFSFYKMTLLECSPSGGSVAAKCTNCCIADENSSLPYMRQLFWNAFLVDEMPGRCKLFNLSHCITRRGDLQPYKPTSWDASFWQYVITKS